MYGDCAGEYVDETRPVRPHTERALRRVDAERQLRQWGARAGVRVSILRAPGIYAADRLPVERLRGGTPALREADDAYVNHVHADDLARMIVAALHRATAEPKLQRRGRRAAENGRVLRSRCGHVRLAATAARRARRCGGVHTGSAAHLHERVETPVERAHQGRAALSAALSDGAGRHRGRACGTAQDTGLLSMENAQASIVLVMTNAPDRATAEMLARALIDARAAACVNIMSPCTSIYRWRGAVETAEEVPVFIKTTADTLSGRRSARAQAPSLRTSGNPCGPSGARPARLPRMGAGRNHTRCRLIRLFLHAVFRAVMLAVLLAPMAGSAALPGQPDLLDPSDAFHLDARAAGPDVIEVRYLIAPGYYLYRDKLRFTSASDAVQLEAAQLPDGTRKHDEFFGEVETYRGDLRIRIPYRSQPGTAQFTLIAVSQGCADVGVCYVPQEQKAVIRVAAAAVTAPEWAASDADSRLFSGAGANDDLRVARVFDNATWLVVLTFFGFGLLLAFTPCVLPMVPILSGIIVGHGHRVTRAHGFSLSLAYVLGMSLTYAIAGVLAGLSGALLSSALQNPWVVGTFSALFVILAGSMLGWYELQLPQRAQSGLSAALNRLPGGRYAAVFVMGALSALIAGPCVAAPLAGALLYIGKSGNVALGGAALFAMAIGMGVPLLLIRRIGRRPVAACRAVDAGGAALFRVRDARRGDLFRIAADQRAGADGRVGGTRRVRRAAPARARPVARAGRRGASVRQGDRHRRPRCRRGVLDRRAFRRAGLPPAAAFPAGRPAPCAPVRHCRLSTA